MDGVGGVTQKHIPPGETYAYEFTLRQHGAQMYHPHSDEMIQMAMGMEGFFIIHPRRRLPGAGRSTFPHLSSGMGHPARHLHARTRMS